MDAAFRSLSAGLRMAPRPPPPASVVPAVVSAVKRARAHEHDVVVHAARRAPTVAVDIEEDEGESEYAADGDDNNDNDSDNDSGDGGAGDNGGPESVQLFAGRRMRSSDEVTAIKTTDAVARRAAASARDDMRALRKTVNLRVYGSDAPDSMATFSGLPRELSAHITALLAATQNVSPAAVTKRHAEARAVLLAIIEESAYAEPSAVQMQALPTLIAGRDLLAAAPTGSGKTAAFALPLLLALQKRCNRVGGVYGPRALILVPTRELAAQTVRELDRLGGLALGLRSTALTRETASGTIGVRVSATRDAADLVRAKKKVKKPSWAATSAAALENAGCGGPGKFAEDEAADKFAEDDVLHWTDEEEDDVGVKAAVGEAVEDPDSGDDDDAGAGRKGAHGTTVSGNGAHGTTVSGNGAHGTTVATQSSSAPGVPRLPHLPKCDIIVATPLILVAVLRHAKNGNARNEPLLASVRHLVLDEVDHLLDMGFIEQVDEILSALPTPEALERLAATLSPAAGAALRLVAPHCHVQRAMLTATLPSGIEELAMTVLRDTVRASVGVRGATASTVEQRLVFVGKERGKVVALRQMFTEGITPPVLVFAQSKDRVEQVARLLALEGATRIGVIHADRSPTQRDDAVTDFRRGKTMFLVTTDVLGRGIDFKGVNVVINFDFPSSAISYVHRIGRTGRAGRAGLAVTFFTEEDIPLLRSIANVMRLSGCDVPAWQLTLKKLGRKERKTARVPQRKNVASIKRK